MKTLLVRLGGFGSGPAGASDSSVSSSVLSGGVSREELGNAGAERVFDNTRELCDRIDETAIAALHA